ncbi:site-specific integrase [Streptomyces sp. NPDC006251]|uniref:site-specific integrase n=1 Tax=Streptomyces sp. NPDC006251 TaxID=3155718 RepID=UPI0033BBAB45
MSARESAVAGELGVSVFAGQYICTLAGLRMAPGTTGPVFEQDVWDFKDVEGFPRSMQGNRKIFDFRKIRNQLWRSVAKEYVVAMLAPEHEAVRHLAHAYRIPRTVWTCSSRLEYLHGWFNWLTDQGITSLTAVDQRTCDAFLRCRTFVAAKKNKEGGETERNEAVEAGEEEVEASSGYRLLAVLVPQEVANYSELFTHDRCRAGFRPWNGASAHSVIGAPKAQGNKTQPARDELLQPLLHNCLFLIRTLAPEALALRDKIQREFVPDHKDGSKRGVRSVARERQAALEQVIRHHIADGQPFDEVDHLAQAGRRQGEWSETHPLVRVSIVAILREAGIHATAARTVRSSAKGGVLSTGGLLEPLKPLLEEAVQAVGTVPPWGRDAPVIPRADGSGNVPWTLPIHRRGLDVVLDRIRTACLIVIALVSGMRRCELIELPRDCRLPREGTSDRIRYRLKSKLIKGQGYDRTVWDEWVVAEEAFHAAGVARDIAGDDASHLFSASLDFDECLKRLRRFTNGPEGARLGLSPIPADQLNLRMLRRTLAVEIAHRPGGLLAAKIQLKHLSVATTEGYANRPGGAQAKFLAEIGEEEQKRNLTLTLEAFRDYQEGKWPAGPGARELLTFFRSVEGELGELHVTTPVVKHSDQEVITLLGQRAGALHLGVANYCWFLDPDKALCLKLAKAKDRSRPLAGMCDSARCPQATHHPCHRPVWASSAANSRIFIKKIGRGQKAERARLQAEADRAESIVAAIDDAQTADHGEDRGPDH